MPTIKKKLNIKYKYKRIYITLDETKMHVVNNIISFFYKLLKSNPNKIQNIIIDLKKVSTPTFSPVLVSLAGIADYYKTKYFWKINFYNRKGSPTVYKKL